MGELFPVWLAVVALAATVVVAVVAARTGVPPSVGLVLVGLVVAFAGAGVVPSIPPALLLAIVLPGLVFEAAFRTDPGDLRRTVAPILILAIPGVVVVALIVAIVLAGVTELSLTEGFIVGAMVAATDPAAVLSTFRVVPVPARLGTTVEMESLVNDGTGIVLFTLALGVAVDGGGSLTGAVVEFLVRVAGGAAIGGVAGWVAAAIARRIGDHLAELTLTVVLAYGAYVAAELLGTSGVIATLVAAVVFGLGARGRLAASSLAAIDEVWAFVAFLLTAGVFLLIGLSIPPSALGAAAGAIGWAILAILVGRAIVVFGLLGGGFALAERIGANRDSPSVGRFSRSWLVVLFWAGLRGAVSVALALSLPATLPNRELLQGVTYGIVLFTLLVQGTSAAWVVRRSGAASGEPAAA
jgi:CPA1 family monovalent cation:H+ antiporter